MRAKQLMGVLANLDQSKRIKFQNSEGWKAQTMAVNAILEQGNAYILIWACHPHCIKEDLKEGQKLVWYNPNCTNSKLVKDYFPDYVSVGGSGANPKDSQSGARLKPTSIEIGNKPIREITAEDLLQIVIIEGCCNVIVHEGEKIWNEPVITDFNNTMFSDTAVLHYNSYRVRDNMKSADYIFFFNHKKFSWHYSRDYELTKKQDGDSRNASIDMMRYLISKGYDVPVYDNASQL